jgi:hypothetical protein
MLAVGLSAVILSAPPMLWLLGLGTIGMAGLALLVVIGPTLIYWILVHHVESRRPGKKLPDVAFAVVGAVCLGFFFGIVFFIAIMMFLLHLCSA